MEDYKIGNIYGYDYYIKEIPFNPDFPGKAPSPRIDCETYMMGKQTFYCLVLKIIFVDGLLTTATEINVPAIQTWDGWVPLTRDEAPYEAKQEAIDAGIVELRERFRKGEFVDWLIK